MEQENPPYADKDKLDKAYDSFDIDDKLDLEFEVILARINTLKSNYNGLKHIRSFINGDT